MHFLRAINSDISVLIVCNKTGGTIKGDIKKNYSLIPLLRELSLLASCCWANGETMYEYVYFLVFNTVLVRSFRGLFF